MPIDFHKLQSELLKNIRGDISQTELSRRLGYSENQVYRWESGKVGFYWNDFCDVCNACGVSLEKSARRWFQFTDIRNSSELVKSTVGLNSIDAIAEQIGRSKHAVYRWASGKTKPRFDEILLLIYKTTNWLFEFLDGIVDAESIESIAEEYRARKKERDFHYQYPLFGALCRCFEITEYEALSQHDDRVIAKYLGVSEEEVAELINLAQQHGLLIKKGGIFQPDNKSLNTSADLERLADVYRYWGQRDLDDLTANSCGNADLNDKAVLRGYNLITTNEVSYKKILQLKRDYYKRLLAILHHDDNRAARAPLDRVIYLYDLIGNLAAMKR